MKPFAAAKETIERFGLKCLKDHSNVFNPLFLIEADPTEEVNDKSFWWAALEITKDLLNPADPYHTHTVCVQRHWRRRRFLGLPFQLHVRR